VSAETTQAIQRAISVFLAELATLIGVIAVSPELRDAILGSLPTSVAAIVAIAIPGILTGIAKALTGATEKVDPPAPGVRAAGVPKRKQPGLWG
jgi:hypothetical protein